MSNYITTLKLADDLFDGMLSGDKRVTIRNGQRNIEVDKHLTIESTNGTYPSVTVLVEMITVLRVKDLSDDFLEADGFEYLEDFIEGMSRFYPNLTEDSVVTVIVFTVV